VVKKVAVPQEWGDYDASPLGQKWERQREKADRPPRRFKKKAAEDVAEYVPPPRTAVVILGSLLSQHQE